MLEAGAAVLLHCENQPYSLASYRLRETGDDWINTTLENWDPQSNWYVCKSQQQRFTGFTLALLNINRQLKGKKEEWWHDSPKIKHTTKYHREEKQVPGSQFPRPHWFPYLVPVSVVVCKTNMDSRAFSCVVIKKQLELCAWG